MSVTAERHGVSDPRAEIMAAGESWAGGQRRLVKFAAVLDASGDWVLDRARTCAHWIAGSLDIEVSTAREWIRVGHLLEKIEAVDAAFCEGRLSYSKVRTLTRVATVENQSELVDLAEHVPAGQLGVALAGWLSRRESPEETEDRQQRERGLWWRTEPDGMVSGGFRLPPAEAAIVTAAIDAAVMARRSGLGGCTAAGSAPSAPVAAGPETRASEWPSMAQQRADQLADLVGGGGGGVAVEVVVHVRADGCSLDDGTPIAGSVVERIAPESFIRVLIHDAESRPINASGRHRHPTLRQRRVVRERDRTCVDCGGGGPFEFDHEPDFEITGRTVIDETRLRCRVCHRARHAAQRG